MPIDKLNDVVDLQSTDASGQLKDILDKICRDATTVKFVSSAPSADNVREGEIVVFDDGSDQEVSVKTAEGNLVGLGVPSGGIILWSGSISSIPSGWYLCDGSNGTPDLTDRFVIHADADSGGTNNVDDTGGSSTHNHTTEGPSAYSNLYGPGTDGAATSSHTHTVSSESNVPKYYALAYIMRA